MLVTWLEKRVYTDMMGKSRVFFLLSIAAAVLAESTVPM